MSVGPTNELSRNGVDDSREADAVTHLRLLDVSEALPWASGPLDERDILEAREYGENLELHHPHLRATAAAYGAEVLRGRALTHLQARACDGARASFARPGERLDICTPLLGELPTCPTCAMLWDVAQGLRGAP